MEDSGVFGGIGQRALYEPEREYPARPEIADAEKCPPCKEENWQWVARRLITAIP